MHLTFYYAIQRFVNTCRIREELLVCPILQIYTTQENNTCLKNIKFQIAFINSDMSIKFCNGVKLRFMFVQSALKM